MSKPASYRKGVRAGYDSKSRRYRDKGGEVISKAQFLRGSRAAPAVLSKGWDDGLGNFFEFEFNPKSEAVLRAVSELERSLTVTEQRQPRATTIPSNILAAMRLAEYYAETQGDVFQHYGAGIDIACNPLEIDCEDPGVQEELRLLYEQIGMQSLLTEIWLCTAIYGSAYPLAVFDAETKKKNSDWKEGDPHRPVLLPPEYVWVGYQSAQESPYALNPLQDGRDSWTQALIRETIKPVSYNSFGSGSNIQIKRGYGIEIRQDRLFPVRDKSFEWMRYPQPSMSRAFRSIGTRFIWQEMYRATLEGYRHQLWVFKIGTDKEPPSVPAMNKLNALVGSAAIKRTGVFTWSSDLTVEVHAPKALDQMIGNDTNQAMTLQVFRDLGSSIRATTGNGLMSGGDRGGAGYEVDLSVFLKRLDFMRLRVYEWERWYRQTLASVSKSKAFAKGVSEARVRFARSPLELSDQIRQELQPLYSMGALSTTTTLERAGHSYQTELARKQKEAPDAHLFGPKATYAQETVQPGTEPGQTLTSPQGRRPEQMTSGVKSVTAALKITAGWQDDEDRGQYVVAVTAAIQQLLYQSRDPQAFISRLRSINQEYLDTITAKYFRQAGGLNLSPSDQGFVSNWVNGFTENFLARLEDDSDQNIDWAKDNRWLHRALLYPAEGFKMASINGQRLAMIERGARGWRRILHPERSKSGPCPLCVADSNLVHGIDEPFVVMHPNEACSAQVIGIQYTTSDAFPTMEVPVPGSPSENEVVKILRSLGFSNFEYGERRRNIG